MAKLIAFSAASINSGDSFYFETKISGMFKNVLVDGGLKENGFVNMFKEVTKRTEIDVVVCTHDDADHTFGIKDLLSSSSEIRINEIWLPAIWINLIDIFASYEDYESFVDELGAEILKYNILIIQANKKEKMDIEPRNREIIRRERYDIDLNDEINPEELLLSILNSEKYTFLKDHHRFLNLLKDDSWCKERQDIYMFFNVLTTFKNILEVARLAMDKGVKIRWLEYTRNTVQKRIFYKSAPLIPLNSREVLNIKRRPRSVSVLLSYLTRVNRESLVFTSRKNKKQAPVLFTADSNLDANEVEKIFVKREMIITTPHHGSKNNEPAFERIKNKLKQNNITKVNWIRGHHQAVTLDDWYTASIKFWGRRYCTKCENDHVVFISNRKVWTKVLPRTFADKCSCKY